MKVILREKVATLGNVGDIVNVAPGHARNFLVPKGFAVFADEKNRKVLENEKKRLQKKIDEEKTAAAKTVAGVKGLELEFFKRVAGNGKLFGTVNTSEISRALIEKGHNIERRIIAVPNPIKSVGTFEVFVRPFEGIEEKITVKVEMDPAQVEEMKKAAERAAKKKAEDAARAAAEAEKAAAEAAEEGAESTETTEA